MRLHHLNCGTRTAGVFADLCTHVLLIETDRGLLPLGEFKEARP